MAYQKHTWVDRVATGDNKFINSGTGNNLILTPNPDSVITEGTPFSAEWMNNIENAIDDIYPVDDYSINENNGWFYVKYKNGLVDLWTRLATQIFGTPTGTVNSWYYWDVIYNSEATHTLPLPIDVSESPLYANAHLINPDRVAFASLRLSDDGTKITNVDVRVFSPSNKFKEYSDTVYIFIRGVAL